MPTYAEALRAEGRVEGQCRFLLRLLRARFGEVPDIVSGQVAHMTAPELEALGTRVLSGVTLKEIIDECSPSSARALSGSTEPRNVLGSLLSVFGGEADPKIQGVFALVGEQFRVAGRVEGQRELFLNLARVHFDEQPAKIEARLEGAIAAMLETFGERFAAAKTLDEVFAE